MNVVGDVVSGGVLNQVADLIGSDKSTTKSAISKFAPAIIGGLIGKGDSVSGAQSLIDIFKRKSYGDNNLSGLGSLLGNKEKTADYLNDGMGMLDMIFGKNMGSVLDKLVNLSGIGRSGGSTLFKFLAPIIMNKLAGMVTGNNWGASKLMNYLLGQKSEVSGLLPGMSGLMGFSANADKSNEVRREVKRETTRRVEDNNSGGGMGWLKWLLPLLLLGALLWFFTKDGCGSSEKVDTTTKVEETKVDKPVKTEKVSTNNGVSTSETDRKVEVADIDYKAYKVTKDGNIVDGAGTVIHKAGEFYLDANGNLVSNDGRIIIPAAMLPSALRTNLKSYLGKYAGVKLKVDDNGNLVDGAGKVIYKKGDYVKKNGFYYDKQGNKLGRIWDKIVAAVSNAAEKTVEGMKNLFSGMFAKKGKAGATSTYLLNDIVFNKENHRIENFSKAEVEGLAAALKADAKSKISVNVFTNDGDSDKESKKLSKKRAEVVRDMLVTLGVNKGQISFSGKGSSDGAKAADDRVEIEVR